MRPFPEEMNRRMADVVSDLQFAPTEHSRDALLREGYGSEKIHVTGNTVIDALLDVASRPFDWAKSPIPDLAPEDTLVLVTAHRRESFGEPFRELCEAIRTIALKYKSKRVRLVYPVHLNPNVRAPVNELLAKVDNVHLIEPVDYFTMVHLMKRSRLILTDSGGVQEEAPSLGVPVLVMRDTTERPEGVKLGVVKLVGTSRTRIIDEASDLLDNPKAHAAMARHVSPYGDGKASQRIVDLLLKYPHART
jgi:UDP-N-acetylglucosamine 2-epimerase